jgi:hypothetical protein
MNDMSRTSEQTKLTGVDFHEEIIRCFRRRRCQARRRRRRLSVYCPRRSSHLSLFPLARRRLHQPICP